MLLCGPRDHIVLPNIKMFMHQIFIWLHANDDALNALSTMLLMIFTGALVVATIFLYLSGEHSARATRRVAEAAKEAAEVAKIAQRAWVSVRVAVGPR